MADPTPEQRQQAIGILKDQLVTGGMDGEDAAKVAGMMIDQAIAGRDYLPVTISGQAGPASVPGPVTAQLATPQDDGTALPPDDAIATSMLTAHAVDDAGHHLSHASQRLGAAGEASGDLRSHHLEHCARHLDDARQSAHDLAGNLRASYPDEGAELGKLTQTIGLARAVSQDAKTATLAHLTETAGHHLGHAIRHVQAMRDDPDPETSEFNAGHARKHLNGAREHVAKLADHLRDNYPAEGGFLTGLGGAGAGAEDGGGISAQMSGPVTVSAQAAETN